MQHDFSRKTRDESQNRSAAGPAVPLTARTKPLPIAEEQLMLERVAGFLETLGSWAAAEIPGGSNG
jgi:hypothetical protein